MKNEKHIAELTSRLRAKYGKPVDSVVSIANLAEEVGTSGQTMRRFLGKVKTKNGNNPVSDKSLSVICRYVGYRDWSHFTQSNGNVHGHPEPDKLYIEHMEPFFRNGKKYNLNYHQNTITVDMLNDYIKVIYATKQNIAHFYNLNHENNWAADYVLAWLPNYNYFGQNWFRAILSKHAAHTDKPLVRLALTNFLRFGAFLTNDNVAYTPDSETLNRAYAAYRKNNEYMPFQEMRYYTNLLIDAKRNNETQKFYGLLHQFLQEFEEQNIREFNKHEVMIFFCNTLIWLKEYQVAYELLKNRTGFITHFAANSAKERALHFYGINLAFMKTTFALTWAVNRIPEPRLLALTSADFDHPTGLLYNDYIHVMYQARCILTGRGAKHKKTLYDELKTLTDKTNYVRIYDLVGKAT